MSKAFTRESEPDDLDEEGNGNGLPSLPSGTKNYITPEGHKRLMDEFLWLMNRERPRKDFHQGKVR